MITTFLKTTVGKVTAALLIGLLLGFAGHWIWGAPKVVKQPGTNTETRYVVNTPVLTPGKDVLKVVADPTEVAKFLKEQQALKNQITTLQEMFANLQTTGGGKIVYVDRPVPGTTQVVREASFKDWRLQFTAKGDDASYLLSQRFEVLSVAGKDDRGVPTVSAKVFEIGPGDKRTELTQVKNTVVVAYKPVRWVFSPTVQAGIGYNTDLKAWKPNATVGLQWLKRGRSKAAEDGYLSILTPVFTASENVQEFGVLPFSFNLGQLPYQPFRDVWVSPYIGVKKHYGVAITASF